MKCINNNNNTHVYAFNAHSAKTHDKHQEICKKYTDFVYIHTCYSYICDKDLFVHNFSFTVHD